MIGFLVSIIRVMTILPFVLLIALALSVIGLSMLLGVPSFPFLPDTVAQLMQNWSLGLTIIPVLVLFVALFITLLFVLSPIILLLGIYDAMQDTAEKHKSDETMLLTPRDRSSRRV